MTHEFIATMLGVQRPGITIAVGVLQKAGLVQHERGRMHILDRKGLEHGMRVLRHRPWPLRLARGDALNFGEGTAQSLIQV